MSFALVRFTICGIPPNLLDLVLVLSRPVEHFMLDLASPMWYSKGIGSAYLIWYTNTTYNTLFTVPYVVFDRIYVGKHKVIHN